jgi:cyanophycin synthetase
VLAAVGWQDESTCVRRYPGGASLAISAPFDALYAACEVNEAAWDLAVARMADGSDRLESPLVGELRAAIRAEQSASLTALADEARQRDVTLLVDDERVSVGLGSGSRSWPVDEIPDPASVDWERIHDIPVALITGTNGKTTTVRMLASIGRASGMIAANTSTDGVQVDGETVLAGDYTGPEGARALLRDRRVEVAVLETARGGLLRRGLPVVRADAACVTNVGHDHFGEYGIDTLEAVAAVKLLVAGAVGSHAAVINADDAVLRAAVRDRRMAVTWFSLVDEPDGLGPEEPLWCLRDGHLGRRDRDGFRPLVEVSRMPATLNGLARHNVANALAAAAVAERLGMSDRAIADGLTSFRSDPEHNPGRGNLIEIGGARAWVDFAHNPEGLRAIVELSRGLERERVLLILGQAGDRDDEGIDALAEIGAGMAPDRIVLKRMKKYLRGRPDGEVVGRLRKQLLSSGYPREHIEACASEVAAVRYALEWARPGDLLLLLLHSDRARVLEWLNDLRSSGWRAGEPVPAREHEED